MLGTLLRRPAFRPSLRLPLWPGLRPPTRAVRTPIRATVAAETLESRIVLSAVSAAPAVDAAVNPDVNAALNVQIESITVTDVRLDETANQLIATTEVVASVLGQPSVTETVDIPINLGTTPGADGECDILNLSLGPVNLDVLGLVVNLDDCAGGPVTVDITGVEGDGNLLGNLVCGITGLLDDGGQLDLGSLTDEQLGTLTDTDSGIPAVLNGVFEALLAGGDDLTAAQVGGGQGNGNGGGQGNGNGNGGGNVTDVLNLRLDATTLNLLGLQVETSDICLDVTAERGAGNLLGNLLGQVAGLLDRGNENALNQLERRLDRIIDQIDSVLGNASDVAEILDLQKGNGKAKGR